MTFFLNIIVVQFQNNRSIRIVLFFKKNPLRYDKQPRLHPRVERVGR